MNETTKYEILQKFANGVLDFWDDLFDYIIYPFLPLLIAFVLPAAILVFMYGCVIFMHAYGFRKQIREAYSSSVWDGVRTSIASFWDGFACAWHGYEVKGIENVPDQGPALFITFHGTLPLDIYYLIANVILYKNRTIHCVADKFVFKVPGWGAIVKLFCATPGTVEDCIANLKNGHLMIIAPGGVREALYCDPAKYNVMWGKRMGFAKVALGANVPIIPVFTTNCHEYIRTPGWARWLTRTLYERTRLPLCPIYGGFPVKMVCHLGEPMYFDPNTSPEDVRDKVKLKIESMIQQHQKLPGNIIRGIRQRFAQTAWCCYGCQKRNRKSTTASDAEVGHREAHEPLRPEENGVASLARIEETELDDGIDRSRNGNLDKNDENGRGNANGTTGTVGGAIGTVGGTNAATGTDSTTNDQSSPQNPSTAKNQPDAPTGTTHTASENLDQDEHQKVAPNTWTSKPTDQPENQSILSQTTQASLDHKFSPVHSPEMGSNCAVKSLNIEDDKASEKSIRSGTKSTDNDANLDLKDGEKNGEDNAEVDSNKAVKNLELQSLEEDEVPKNEGKSRGNEEKSAGTLLKSTENMDNFDSKDRAKSVEDNTEVDSNKAVKNLELQSLEEDEVTKNEGKSTEKDAK